MAPAADFCAKPLDSGRPALYNTYITDVMNDTQREAVTVTIEEHDMETMADRINDHLQQAEERMYQAARDALAGEYMVYTDGDWCWA